MKAKRGGVNFITPKHRSFTRIMRAISKTKCFACARRRHRRRRQLSNKLDCFLCLLFVSLLPYIHIYFNRLFLNIYYILSNALKERTFELRAFLCWLYVNCLSAGGGVLYKRSLIQLDAFSLASARHIKRRRAERPLCVCDTKLSLANKMPSSTRCFTATYT